MFQPKQYSYIPLGLCCNSYKQKYIGYMAVPTQLLNINVARPFMHHTEYHTNYTYRTEPAIRVSILFIICWLEGLI